VEVGGYGIAPYFAGAYHDAQGAFVCTQINAMVPPGLATGAAIVKVYHGAQTSNEAEIELVEGGLW
jgi:uncharacterized protein (TIGR03437 family)